MIEQSDLVFVPRYFREIAASAEDDNGVTAPLEDFFSKQIIVVLGEPGLGKTTEFKRARDQEPDAVYLKLGRFLESKNPTQWQGKVLYLDGLDEHRARINDQTVMDKLIGQLESTGFSKLRLSCRTQDWHHGSDVRSLGEISNEKDVTILSLQPLTDSDIRMIVSQHRVDPETFLDGASTHGIEPLLTNPQTLILLLKAMEKENGWPSTRRELLEKACAQLLEEKNEGHVRASESSFSKDTLEQAADELAAFCLLGGLEGVALSAVRAGDDFPAIDTLGCSVAEMQEAARRNLFIPVEPERIAPRHRTLGEFMSARCLARKITEGLPLGRVRTLITGYDGGTLSDLRGVFAWLVCLLPPEQAFLLLRSDPYGAAVYGDPASWSLSMCKTALDQMSQLANDNPWFRSHGWENYQILGGLARPELVEEFRAILKETKQNHLRGVVLDALQYGCPLPEMGEALLDSVRNDDDDIHFRVETLLAFIHCCPDQWADLQPILDDIRDGRLDDPDLRIYGTLLRLGYPNHISPLQIVGYIWREKESVGHYGSFDLLVSGLMIEATPEDSLVPLLDALIALPPLEDHTLQCRQRCLIRRLLDKIIAVSKAPIPPEQMYRWLGGMVTEWGSSTVTERETQNIRSYIQDQPNLYQDMFRIWLDTDSNHNWNDLEHRLCFCPSPLGFSKYLLDCAINEQNDEKASFLFRAAGEHVRDPITIEKLYDTADLHPRFARTLRWMMYHEFQNWHFNHRDRSLKHNAEQERFLNGWREHSDKLRYARHLGGLDSFALKWFGLQNDNNPDKSWEECFVKLVGEKLKDAAFAGFEAILCRDDLPSIAEISRNYHEGQRYRCVYPILAGMDIIAARSIEELLALPEITLSRAFAVNWMFGLGDKREWPNEIAKKYPQAIRNTFWEILDAQLAVGAEEHHISPLPQEDSPLADIAIEFAPDLLRKHPNAPKNTLKSLLRFALKRETHVECLLPVVQSALRQEVELTDQSRLIWLCTGYLLSPKEYGEQLEQLVVQSHEMAKNLYDFLRLGFWREPLPIPLSTEKQVFIARLLARSFDRMESPCRSGMIDESSPEELASGVRTFIAGLAQDPSREMTEALRKLREDNTVQTWGGEIAHAAVEQSRTRREKEFIYPSVGQVVATLANKAPANAADLQALVMAILGDIGIDLRHGNTDGWKTFWNTDSHEKATEPRIENQCRDRLMERLNDRLAQHELSVEREGDFAQHKRADLIVYQSNHRKLPIEIKRMQHPDLWTAMNEQLIKQYCRDPKCEDRGIYLVLWFGGDYVQQIPKALGNTRPITPEGLKEALIGRIFPSHEDMVKVVVLDVGKPEENIGL